MLAGLLHVLVVIWLTGIGAAFLLLNIIVFIGICCQRDKLKTERKSLEKMRQVSPNIYNKTRYYNTRSQLLEL